MNKEKEIYQSNGKFIYRHDIVKALKKLGIKKGDVIFVHSDVSVFGKLCSFDRNFILSSLVEALKESVGENGTLIIPTFTYSFCRDEVYDVDKSMATIGALPEFFRKQPGVIRTNHPIFSVGIWGENKNEFANIGKDSFGKDSIFGKIHKNKGKIVILGPPFKTSITFNYYVEQSYGVPYRYMKTFKGKIRKGDKEYEDKFTYFVRYLNKKVVTNIQRFKEHLIEKGVLNKVKLGDGEILMVESDKWYEEGFNALDKDLFFFLKDRPRLKNYDCRRLN